VSRSRVPWRASRFLCPERGPEAIDMEVQSKRGRKRARQPEHEAIDDEREKAEREDDEWKREDFRDRSDDGIHDAEDEGHTKKRQSATCVEDTWNDPGRNPEGGGVDKEAHEKRHSTPRILRQVSQHIYSISSSAVLALKVREGSVTRDALDRRIRTRPPSPQSRRRT
jgi:hypothetical protein